jgi:deazaflavin-dependent oxidoreductase (nitroreductase family)
MNLRRLGDVPIKWILRSPLHQALSGSILLLTVRGRKTGHNFTVPVNYVAFNDELLIVSRPGQTWDQELIGGAQVEARIEGDDYAGRAQVLTDQHEKEAALLSFIRRSPQYCKRLGIVITPTGNPANPTALQAVAGEWVVIRVSRLRVTDGSDFPPPIRSIPDQESAADQAA